MKNRTRLKRIHIAIILILIALFWLSFKFYISYTDDILIGAIYRGDTTEVNLVLNKYPLTRLNRTRTLSLKEKVDNFFSGLMIMTDAYASPKLPPSPLRIAIKDDSYEMYGNIEMFSYLLNNGLAPDENSEEFKNLIRTLIYESTPELLDTLMSHYPYSSSDNWADDSLLVEAIDFGRRSDQDSKVDYTRTEEMIYTLLTKYNVPYNNAVDSRYNPLLKALEIDNLNLIKIFIENGADVNLEIDLYHFDQKSTVLKEAIRWRHSPEICDYLKSQGADTLLSSNTLSGI